MNDFLNILESVYNAVAKDINTPIIDDEVILGKVDVICRNLQNRACSRFLLACLLAKIQNPKIDIRKPYTEIRDKDSYSGRTIDEAYISPFVFKHDLPCNPTTAFLTPAFRNRNIVLTPDLNMVGRPPEIYKNTLELLSKIESKKIKSKDLLSEVIRTLLVIRKERLERMNSMLESLRIKGDRALLSVEAITNLIEQHIKSPNSSRLPVLMVTAAYKTVENNLGEKVLPLYAHNAADKQTGALGDLQIALIDDDKIVTCYEMKTKKVIQGDIDVALQKIGTASLRIDNLSNRLCMCFISSVPAFPQKAFEL